MAWVFTDSQMEKMKGFLEILQEKPVSLR